MFRLDGPAVTQKARLILAVLVLGLWLAPRDAWAAERFLVIESPPFQVRAAEQDRLIAAIQTGLRAAGCEVVLGSARPDSCTTADCWRKLAASNQVTDILVVSGGYKDLGWSLSFDHRDGASGARVGSERENCDACPFDAMLEKARSTAQHMAESDRGEANAAVAAQPAARPAPPIPPGAVTEPEANPLTTPPTVSASESHPLWPIFLIAGGGAVLAGGIVLMAIDGRDTDCSQESCLRRYKTMTPGLILGGVGLAAAAVGIWQYIAWQPAGTTVSLRLGPGNFSLTGGF
jgi:hypothetical protein